MSEKVSVKYEIKVAHVVGPLPDSSAIIVCLANNKMFPIPCSFADGSCCHDIILNNQTMYSHVFDLLKINNTNVVSANIVSDGHTLYGTTLFKVKGKKQLLKISSEHPARAINLALSSGTKIEVDEKTINSLKDCTEQLHALRSFFKETYPLPCPIHSTVCLEALSNFVDKVVSDDSKSKS